MSFSISYDYIINDRMSAAFAKMSAAASKFDGAVATAGDKITALSSRMQQTGARMTNLQSSLAGLGAGMVLKNATDEMMSFQRSLNMTRAVTGATAEDMEVMRAKALEWGSQTQFSSNQVAGAMAELGKMGNKTNEILDLMPGTMALAAAGEINMAEAANYSMGILNQFGMNLNEAGVVADVLARGASGAATSVAGLSSAMSNTGLQASMAGLSIQDTTAALMAMASKNLEGAEAGTMMMNTLKSLQVMPDKVREGFDKMGIDIDQFRDVTTGQMTDFWGLIAAMKEAGATGAQLGEMFDVRAMKGMAVLIETSSEQMASFRDQMNDTTGASKAMADTLLDGLGPFVEYQSIMQNLKVIMGTFVAEALTPVLKKFNAWMSNVQQNNPMLLKMATYTLMVVAALAAILVPLGLLISSAGQVVWLIGSIVTLWGKFAMATKLAAAAQAVFNAVMAVNPIVWIILGIIALIAAIVMLVKHWDKVKEAVIRVWNWFSALLDNPLIAAAAVVFAPFLAIPALIVKHWDIIRQFFVDLWGSIKDAFTASIEFIKGVLFTFADYMLTIYGTIAKAILGSIKNVSNALGKETPRIDAALGKIQSLQDTVRAQSFFGGIERPESAPVPQGGGGVTRAEASVSVYTEEGMAVRPFTARGNLGYNMQGSYAQ